MSEATWCTLGFIVGSLITWAVIHDIGVYRRRKARREAVGGIAPSRSSSPCRR